MSNTNPTPEVVVAPPSKLRRFANRKVLTNVAFAALGTVTGVALARKAARSEKFDEVVDDVAESIKN